MQEYPLTLGTCTNYLTFSFYRDPAGQAPLRDHGFMIEWAKQAGKLVFQEAEDLHEDNIVTFCNLALFWFSQGSWRIAYLHKGIYFEESPNVPERSSYSMLGNACQLLYIIGRGPQPQVSESSLESEIRRRRFWACYLIHCHNAESLSGFQPIADIVDLPLPWHEDEFDSGVSKTPSASMKSAQSNGGIFSELIKILTLW
jgi:hypothetical protein